MRGFVGSLNSNAELWGSLAARLHARTISIPRHERLLAELHGLRQEMVGLSASKWRVVDSSRRFHRDVSLALAGACFAAGEAPRALRFLNLDTPAESVDEQQAEHEREQAEKIAASAAEIEAACRSNGGWFGGR